MGVIAVTGKTLENIEPKPYFNEMLLVFTQSTNSYKVAIDTEGTIVDLYNSIAESNDLIATWLHLMAISPSNFEPIDKIELAKPKCECEIYILLASKIAGEKRLITNSIQDLKLYQFKGSKIIDYDSIDIRVYDKDDALNELRNNMTQKHSGSGDNVAGNKYS